MAKKKKDPQQSGPSATTVRASADRYEIQEVHRSQLADCPFNPRQISDEARRRLRANLEKIGLTHPPVWNKRTGHIISGHQRIHIIDSIMGTSDYTIRVAVVDLDPKQEKEQVVFENNGEAQGQWDLEKLEKLFREDKIDIEAAGFNTADIFQMFGDSPLIEQPEELAAAAERVRAAREAYDKTVEKSAGDRDDPHFYLMVIFRDNTEREKFTAALGLPDNRYVDGKFLKNALFMDARDLIARLGKGETPPPAPETRPAE
jgi:hypothetical protein